MLLRGFHYYLFFTLLLRFYSLPVDYSQKIEHLALEIFFLVEQPLNLYKFLTAYRAS